VMFVRMSLSERMSGKPAEKTRACAKI
jgi:hypothetical protein